MSKPQWIKKAAAVLVSIGLLVTAMPATAYAANNAEAIEFETGEELPAVAEGDEAPGEGVPRPEGEPELVPEVEPEALPEPQADPVPDPTPQQAPLPLAGDFGVYNAGDVAAINKIITDNQLYIWDVWEAGQPMPENWSTGPHGERITWTPDNDPAFDAANRRVMTLDVNQLQLSTLDVTGLTELQLLACSQNNLTALNLAGLAKLMVLECGDNSIDELDLTGLPLDTLICDKNELEALDISGLPGLITLVCNDNNLSGMLDVSASPNLQFIHCFNNALTGIVLGVQNDLVVLECSQNELESMDVSGAPNMSNLYCANNKLQTLTLGTHGKLKELGCDNNALQTLDISAFPELVNITCAGVNSLVMADRSVALAASPATGGLVKIAQVNINSNKGEVSMQFVAEAAEGYQFASWAHTGFPPHTFALDRGPDTDLFLVPAAAMTLTANFVRDAAITITQQPVSALTVTAGSITESLSVLATLTPPGAAISYKWMYTTQANPDTPQAVPGGTSATLALPAGLIPGSYVFRCEVSAPGAEMKTSAPAVVTVEAPPPVPLTAEEWLVQSIQNAPADGTLADLVVPAEYDTIQLPSELTILAGQNIRLSSDHPVTLKNPVDVIAGPCRLFTVAGKFTVGGGITLQGSGAVEVRDYEQGGGAVLVKQTGVFTLEGGIIKDCAASEGGGAVFIAGGRFVMNDGLITGCSTLMGTNIGSNGGAVYVQGGVFEMKGGILSENLAYDSVHEAGDDMGDEPQQANSYLFGKGGGVYVGAGGSLVLSGNAQIRGNEAKQYGGGVYVHGTAGFVMQGGTVAENTAVYLGRAAGGGVYVDGTFSLATGTVADNTSLGAGGVFNMQGGAVSGGDKSSYSTEVAGVYAALNTTISLQGGVVEGNEGFGVITRGSLALANSAAIKAHASGGVHLQSGSNFTMAGGEISGNATGGQGGGVWVDGGSFVMEGGIITGNTAQGRGGGVSVTAGSFELKNGQIVQNVVQGLILYFDGDGGGGVFYAASAGSFVMRGGKIANNKVLFGQYSGDGGGVHGSVQMFGGEISGNSVPDTPLVGLGGGVFGRVSMENGKITGNTGCGVYATGDTAIKGGEVSGNTRYGISAQAANVTINSGVIQKNAYDGVRVSDGNFTMTGGTISQNTFTGITIIDGDFLMNGGEISTNKGTGVYVSNGKATLEKGLVTGNMGGGLKVYDTRFTMKGGTVSLNRKPKSAPSQHDGPGGYGGGGVNVEEGHFIMSGGTITANTVEADINGDYGGGGVLVFRGAFTMDGGEITNNTVKSNAYGGSGGGVYAEGSEVVINNGSISGNTAETLAAGSYPSAGGGIWMGNGTLAVKGGAVIGNSADSGGGVYVSTGVYADSSFALSGGKISGNTAKIGGGVYSANNGDAQMLFTMTGGEVTQNTAQGLGGGVYNIDVMTMSGGTIADNTAVEGGGVYNSYYANFSMSGGAVLANMAANDDAVIYNDGTLSISGGAVINDKGYNAIVNAQGATVTISGGFVFSRGDLSSVQTVVFSHSPTSRVINGGLVCAWSKNPGAQADTYTAGASTNLAAWPEGAAKPVWASQGGQAGIRYQSGATSGFVPLPVVITGGVVQNTVSFAPPAGFAGTRIYLDGVEYAAKMQGGKLVMDAPKGNPATATMYKYDDAGVPVGMAVWALSYSNGVCTATAVPQLEDLMTYHGFAVRVTGNTGIRFKTGVDAQMRQALLGSGVAGYKLKEYGTLVMTDANRARYPFVKGGEKVIGGVAYGKSANGQFIDAVFETVAGRHRYTSVLTGLPPAQYKTDFAFRGYVILTKDGQDHIFYGPVVSRSMATVAQQVLNSGYYAVGSSADQFLRGLI